MRHCNELSAVDRPRLSLAEADANDDQMLEKVMAGSRCSFEDVAATGFVDLPFEFPAPWVERFLYKSGGWRLAPQLLVDQLADLEPPAPLVLVPRRQPRKLNAALDFLGEAAVVQLHPEDAEEAGVVDGQPVVVRSHRGEVTGIAKVDPAIRRGVVSMPHGHYRANVNHLSDKDVIDPVTGMVRYLGTPVSVEPVSVSPSVRPEPRRSSARE